jgi:DNA-binding response OmpR family regulator
MPPGSPIHEGRLDPGVELLTKPFSQAALAAKLRDIIDARAAPARVLIVEDEVLIQLMAKEYLEDAGLRVDTATTATDALNKLRLIPGGVDAVIIDMRLPDRKGDELAREVKATYPTTPIVIASGETRENLRPLFRDVATVSFAAKPYSAQDLYSALRAVGIAVTNAAQYASEPSRSRHTPRE